MTPPLYNVFFTIRGQTESIMTYRLLTVVLWRPITSLYMMNIGSSNDIREKYSK